MESNLYPQMETRKETSSKVQQAPRIKHCQAIIPKWFYFVFVLFVCVCFCFFHILTTFLLLFTTTSKVNWTNPDCDAILLAPINGYYFFSAYYVTLSWVTRCFARCCAAKCRCAFSASAFYHLPYKYTDTWKKKHQTAASK